jgi:phosphoadenosine phosphosulfate reductase
MTHFELPAHPLVAEGYHSIGCVPCTVKGGSNDNPRAGRWAGQSKEECGIHWTVNGQPVRLAKAG